LHEVFISSPILYILFVFRILDLYFLLEFHQFCWQARVGFWVGKLKTFQISFRQEKMFLVSNEYVKDRKSQYCSVYHPSLY
jgi:hypothetical protein